MSAAPETLSGRAHHNASGTGRRRIALIVTIVVLVMVLALVVTLVVVKHLQSGPRGPATTLYIADTHGYVEKVTPDGVLTIIAGNGDTKSAPTPGPAINSPMLPMGMAVDGTGNIYIADRNGYLLKITPDGILSIVAGYGTSWLTFPGTVAVAGDDLYLATIDQIQRLGADGALKDIAGVKNQPSTAVPGPAINSHICPWGGLVLDKAGNIYVADPAGYVFKISPDGMLSILAGNGNHEKAPIPGPATQSPMRPRGLTLDAGGNVLIADYNGYLEKVTPDGALSIIAIEDMPLVRSTEPASSSFRGNPVSVAVDSSGNIYLAVFGGDVQQITEGASFQVAGSSTVGSTPVPGPATKSPMNPVAVAVSPNDK